MLESLKQNAHLKSIDDVGHATANGVTTQLPVRMVIRGVLIIVIDCRQCHSNQTVCNAT